MKPAPQDSEDTRPPARGKAATAAIGFAIGVVLIAAAGWVLYQRRADMEEAWRSVAHAHPGLLALALLLPLVNWLLISTSFWLLMRRHGEIGAREMGAAIGAAWLLNFLPLRAGMVGRVAYHKSVNGITIRDSVRVMVAGLALGAVSIGVLLLIVLALSNVEAYWIWGSVLALPLLAALAAWAVLTRNDPRAVYAAVLAIRYVDLLVWTGRYAVVFALVGTEIDLRGAVAFAVVCQAALVVPFIGNGLGVREWAIGLTAAALPAAVLGADMGATTGLLADLVNRAAEVVVVIPVGILSVVYLSQKMRRAGAVEQVRDAVAEMSR